MVCKKGDLNVGDTGSSTGDQLLTWNTNGSETCGAKVDGVSDLTDFDVIRDIFADFFNS